MSHYYLCGCQFWHVIQYFKQDNLQYWHDFHRQTSSVLVYFRTTKSLHIKHKEHAEKGKDVKVVRKVFCRQIGLTRRLT